MRNVNNVKWMSGGLCLGLLTLAGPSFADGLQPSTQNGAAAAVGGVEVLARRQSCSQTVETEQPGNDLVEAVVELEIRNATSAPIGVHRDRFRLVAPDGRAIGTSTWFAGAPRSVDPGRAQTFQLRFMSRGGLSCDKEMVLESSSAVVKGMEGVNLDSVRLAPSPTLSGYAEPR